MKPRYTNLGALAFAALLAAPLARAAMPASDILPPDLRRTTVEKAQRLAQPPPPPNVPADLPSPFAPAGYEDSDGSEAGQPAAKSEAPPPPSNQQVLETLADKIPTTGTIIMRGTPLLVSGTNRIEVGSRFTVVYNGKEYELELVAIGRTTFTVRYKGEQFTRPIKLVTSP